MPHGCVIARFSRVRPTRRRSLRDFNLQLLRDLQVAKVRPYCDNNGELGEWGHCEKRGHPFSTRFISYVDSAGVMFTRGTRCVWSSPRFDPLTPSYLRVLRSIFLARSFGFFLSSRFFRSRYIRYLVPDFPYSPQFPPLYFFHSVSTVSRISRDIFSHDMLKASTSNAGFSPWY